MATNIRTFNGKKYQKVWQGYSKFAAKAKAAEYRSRRRSARVITHYNYAGGETFTVYVIKY